MSFADPESPLEVLMAHSAWTRPNHIECGCGWTSPPYEEKDPRTAHAEHVREKMAEKYAVIPHDVIDAEKMSILMDDPIHEGGYGEDTYDFTINTYSAAESIVKYLKEADK